MNAREWLDDWERTTMEANRMRDALLAALDLHARDSDEEGAWCHYCAWLDMGGDSVEEWLWPCATVRAINEALGTTDD